MHYFLNFKKSSRRDRSIFLLAAALATAAVLMYRGLGNWLLVQDPLPGRIDAIFTFGGENVRDRYSRDLALRYPEAIWILSTHNAAARVRTLDLEQLNARRLLVVDTLKNTWEEVRFLREWLAQREKHLVKDADGPCTVVLVSGPYHMRRIRIAVARQLNHHPCEFSFVPAPMELYSHTPGKYRTWWRDTTLNPLVKLELVKTLYYLFRL